MLSLFTLEEKNNGRISQLLNHWKIHTCLDPPKIYFDSFTNKINVEDGRHRTKLAFFLDFKKIPIAIYKEDVKDQQPKSSKISLSSSLKKSESKDWLFLF
jgi:hypothetical protein